MAFVEGREMFKTIRNSSRFALLLPEDGAAAAEAVLYLLPVRRGLATDWVRYTGIELWARKRNIAVVMPEGVSSDFCNMVHGMKWWDYLTEELPEYLKTVFGLPEERCFCFGAEMGAIASTKLGLICPEKFAAAGAVGADFSRISRYALGEVHDHDMESVYGELPVADEILASGDPLRIAAECQKAENLLFLNRSDAGVQQIVEACGRSICWCDASAEDWEGYGNCLKEFLEKVIDKDAKK